MEQPWIHKAKTDLAFIIGPSFFVLALIFLFQDYITEIENEYSFYTWLFLIVFIDVAHVYATLFKTYFEVWITATGRSDWRAANVTLVRIHMAFGIGGKCYQVLSGDIADVQTAVDVASQCAGEKGLLVYSSVIPRPHEALWRQLVQEA